MKKFDPKKPVETRDGRPARIICTNRVGIYPIVTLVKYGNTEHLLSHTSEGFASNNGCQNTTDLINPPVRKSVFRNIYPRDISSWAAIQDWPTLNSAKTAIAYREAVGTLEIQFEDGEVVGLKTHKKGE